MEETIYLMVYYNAEFDRKDLLKAYDDKADAKQALKKEATMRDGLWREEGMNSYVEQSDYHRLRLEEIELTRTIEDPRKERRW